MPDVSVVGGSGYAGGELVRLLLDHPHATLKQVTSERSAGKFVRSLHPNLRKRTELKFVSVEALQPCDVLFVALPQDRKSTRLNSSHANISYAVFCLKKKNSSYITK